MASPPEPALPPDSCFSDVRKVGYLRKPKSMHKRFFVLRGPSAAGPARLEYYESEKKWRHKAAAPKRCIRLESCLNINKRADAKHKHLLALYTREECFSLAADTPQEQEGWYRSLLEELQAGGGPPSPATEEPDHYNPAAAASPAFREVWQVILKPKGLGQSRNLTGVYRLCLGPRTLSLVKLHAEAAALVLQLMNIRRCGHSEGFFFMELGRSAATGPGELWMQVDDAVVAQSMHETILDAMKAMSDEFRPRSKSQSAKLCSNPISVPVRRPQPPGAQPPPSQAGPGRRSRTDSQTSPRPAAKPCASFRVRASSDGEGSVPSSRPASGDGSPVSPGRAHSSASCCQRQHRGGARLHPPLSHSRSIPTAAACRRSPAATSPVSLSSSSTSGHGSTSDVLFPRRPSASVSGSPSDGGFISSDEYGSSPCDFRSSFRCATPDFLGHTPPAGGDELGYICMGRAGPGRLPPPRCTPGQGEEHDPDKSFRKRTHSAGTSPPPPAGQHKPPCQACSEDYTEMMPPCRLSAFMPPHCYPEERPQDDGYMPMSPGVAPLPAKGGDYMPMGPKSVSAPQEIMNPRRPQTDPNGYMMMSPSGSCSPEGYSKIWTNGVHPKLSVDSGPGGDYMNMSPASGSTTSTPPDCYLPPEEAPPPACAYYSLPRSFKHLHRKSDEGPAHLVLHAEDSSSSTSSDSLGGQAETTARLARPTRLSLDKASTLPRAREPPESKSPGEYVNIDLNCSTSLCSPPYIESRVIPQRETLSEYMNMDLGARMGKASARTRDYMSMHPSLATSDYAEVSTTSRSPSINYDEISAGSRTEHDCKCVEVPPAHGRKHVINYGGISPGSRTGSNYVEVPLVSTVQSISKCRGLSAESRINTNNCMEMPPDSRVHHNGNYGELSLESRTENNSNYVEMPPTSSVENIKKYDMISADSMMQTTSRIQSANNYVGISSQSRIQNSRNYGDPLASRIPSTSNYAPARRKPSTDNYAEMLAESRMKKQSSSTYVGRPPASRLQKVTLLTPVAHSDDYAEMPTIVDRTRADMPMGHTTCCPEVYSGRINRSYTEPTRTLACSEVLLANRVPSTYAEIACGRNSENTLFPKPVPPQDLPGPAAPSLLPGQGSGLSAFTRVSLSPGHSSARVIRADPQGRRRHSSETFSSTPSAARGAAPLPCAEDGKRHSSASFENVSLRAEPSKEPPRDTPLILNYIDLDLGEDLLSHLPRDPGQPCVVNSSEDMSPYARISFQKSEDLRSTSAKEE